MAQEQKSVSARGPFNLWVLLGVSRDLTLLFRAERQAAAATACTFRHTCNFIASRSIKKTLSLLYLCAGRSWLFWREFQRTTFGICLERRLQQQQHQQLQQQHLLHVGIGISI